MALPLLPGRMGSGTTIELSGSNGVRMRIEVAGGLDIGELVHKVWSGNRSALLKVREFCGLGRSKKMRNGIDRRRDL
jgi:hypothetical protein